MIITLILISMVLLLLLQGFFSGSEIALVHADKLKMHHLASRGHKGAQLVQRLFEKPEVMLGTTLVGTNVSVVTLTTLGTLVMIHYFGEYGDIIAFIVYTPLFLIFGEVVPKSVYQQKADTFAPRIIYPLRFFSLVFYPLVFVFSRLARLIARIVGVSATHHDVFITREQVRMMLEIAEQAANVDVFDRDRLMRAIRFASITVGEVMVPLAELTMIKDTESTAEAVKLARERGYFRLPVYREEPGQVIGVLSLTMWELMDHKLINRPLDELIRPALFVSAQQPVDELLDVLQQREDQMAIVVDEFGSASGMLTLEALIEEVIGEVINVGYSFESHLPRHRGNIERLGNERFRVDGRVPLSDITDLLGIALPAVDAHTVGGMLMSVLRHIPGKGESITHNGYRFTVEEATEKSVSSVRIEPL
jgi:CBS domain containing-hemolysin-like protein